MSSLTILLVSIFCVLHLHGSGVHGLECYSCTNCSDPFQSSGVPTKNCSESCWKMKNEQGGKQLVIRSCGLLVFTAEKCEKEKYRGIDVEWCRCTGNLCNGANDIKMRLTLPIICTAILAFARKLI